MTHIQHHAHDDILMGYATGTLPQAFDLVVASHVSLSDDARARLESLEAIGGAVLEDIDMVDLAEDSLSQTLAKIGGEAPIEAPQWKVGVFPSPLQQVVGGDEEAVRWRNVGRGVKQCILHSDEDGTVRLLSIPAGRSMPAHSHNGTEMTLVLKGAFRDEDGVFARGDIEVADANVDHTPVAEPGEDCICLVATDARLKFRGLLPRIAQPFLGI
ncbi:ChrR family anti-sigma-E factor [Gymnodinialimonas sp. 2305UL16-5]|uniref:ChrR family anti-sigma-E factor n=1 Tax=Gymnodinialimonas mytili TaxID=3126503 RepID=UPI0030974DB6